MAVGLEADFTESFKPTAMDIRKRLKALDTDLSAAVKPVPIQNSLAKSYTLPEIDLGLPDVAFFVQNETRDFVQSCWLLWNSWILWYHVIE